MSAAVGLRWKTTTGNTKTNIQEVHCELCKVVISSIKKLNVIFVRLTTTAYISIGVSWFTFVFLLTQIKKHIQSHQWPCGTHYLMFLNNANETCWVHSGFPRLSRWPRWLELVKTDCKAPLFSNVCRYLPCETKQRQREWREWLLFVSLSARATDGRWEIKCGTVYFQLLTLLVWPASDNFHKLKISDWNNELVFWYYSLSALLALCYNWFR